MKQVKVQKTCKYSNESISDCINPKLYYFDAYTGKVQKGIEFWNAFINRDVDHQHEDWEAWGGNDLEEVRKTKTALEKKEYGEWVIA